MKNLILKIEAECSIAVFSKENCRNLTKCQIKKLKEMWKKNIKQIDFGKEIDTNYIKEKLNSQTNCTLPFLDNSLMGLYKRSKGLFDDFVANLSVSNVKPGASDQNLAEESFQNGKTQFLHKLKEMISEYQDV